MKQRRYDLIGQRFGRGTVIAKIGNDKNGCTIWELICDCGNHFTAITGNLNYRHVKSCGCYNYESRLPGIKAAAEKISLPYGEASFRELYRSYKAGAKNRKLQFEIEPEIFRNFTKQPCSYCGQLPSTVFSANRFSGEYIYNGIDRIDSTKGYVIGNLCTCCKTCNFAKRNMTKSDFLCWVERVYQYSVKQTSKSLVDVEVE